MTEREGHFAQANRPIVLGPNEMRNVEKERERLIRLFDED